MPIYFGNDKLTCGYFGAEKLDSALFGTVNVCSSYIYPTPPRVPPTYDNKFVVSYSSPVPLTIADLVGPGSLSANSSHWKIVHLEGNWYSLISDVPVTQFRFNTTGSAPITNVIQVKSRRPDNNMGDTDYRYMCQNLHNLRTYQMVPSGSAIENTYGMFQGCENLTHVRFDEGNWYLSRGDFGFMFAGCTRLEQITYIDTHLQNGSVSKQHMFDGCTNLKNFHMHYEGGALMEPWGSKYRYVSDEELANAPTYKYFRLRLETTENNDRYMSISQLKLYDIQGRSMSLSNAWATSHYGSDVPSNALNGNAHSAWVANQVPSQMFGFDLRGYPITMKAISIQARYRNPDRTPIRFTVQGSNVGKNGPWTDMKTFSQNIWQRKPWTTGETRMFLLIDHTF